MKTLSETELKAVQAGFLPLVVRGIISGAGAIGAVNAIYNIYEGFRDCSRSPGCKW